VRRTPIAPAEPQAVHQADMRQYRFELVARLQASLIFPGEKHD
jgi:hypothetical protein